ncbi:uncharacterized protein N7498_009422 [Penicillium cinerascens]|uniref:Fatty acid desaturase domain-containing protein n=1 Tax=Penicillium cinerascens TaxID=70096 RepID=A0A9W9J6C7_9EURO|nr:uncharacterized protein N7498_009422 [Penicillium cinerascens]KAJ5190437.1 hypothetical protein N7498_009422 [Penicillium cinerascens]
MLILLILSLVTQALAQSNSTVLVGWQFDGDSRSSWDILWTCLSTIMACTWTALHVNHHQKNGNSHMGASRIKKSFAWFVAMLAPEMMAYTAVEEYWEVKLILARCNSAQLAYFSNKKASSLEPITKIATHKNEKELETTNAPTVTKDSEEEILGPLAPEDTESSVHVFRLWKMAQAHYIRMGGFVLRTKDNWVYIVRAANVVGLIQAGIIKPSALKISDIKDRDKSDPLSKLFTLLQTTWVTVNIIARRAYHLPISPLELSTAAYVACALVTYLAWWNKPKDVDTLITFHLPYDRDSDEMPSQLRNADKRDWMHMPLAKDDAESDEGHRHRKRAAFVALLINPVRFWREFKRSSKEINAQRAPKQTEMDTPADNSEETPDDDPDRFDEQISVGEQFRLDVFAFIAGLIFCGIHIAG